MASPPGTILYTHYGHSGAVYGLAWSPDSRRLASASTDNTVQVWDINRGGIIVTYGNHLKPVRAVAWSPNGKLIASASEDETIQLWDVITGHNILTYRGHLDWVRDIAWSPSGKHIVSAGSDGTVQVWDATTGYNFCTYQGQKDYNYDHSKSVNAVVWSPDGTHIASAGADNTVHIWDALTGNSIITYHCSFGRVNDLAWSPNGTHVASVSVDGTIQVWDVFTGHESFSYHCHSGGTNVVAWSPDGTWLVSAGTGIYITSPDTSREKQKMSDSSEDHINIYNIHSDTVNAVAWSPNGRYIATGSWDKTVQIWQAPYDGLTVSVSEPMTDSTPSRLGATICTYKGHSSRVYAVTWAPNGERIASASADGTMQIWDADTGYNILICPHSDQVYTVVWSTFGKRIISGGREGNVRLWDADTGHHVFTYDRYVVEYDPHLNDCRYFDTFLNEYVNELESSYVYALAWSPDASQIVSAGSSVYLWDTSIGYHLTYDGPSNWVYSAAWSPSGQYIAYGDDTGVQVWNAVTRSLVFTYHGHSNRVDTMNALASFADLRFARVNAVAWSPNSARIASASDDGTVQVWDAINGSNAFTYVSHSDTVNAVAWSPDGTRIASASSDRTVRVWDATTGRSVFTYRNHSDRVNAVAWSLDGTRIASASNDGTVQVRRAV